MGRGELHDYDPHGASTRTPQEACDQAFRRGANHAAAAIADLCRKNPGRELEIVLAAEEITGEVRTKWPKKWADWYMHRLLDEICKKLRIKGRRPRS